MASYTGLHLDQDEHVILEVRKHWIVFIGYAISLFFAAFLPFVLFLAFKIFVPQVYTFATTSIRLPGNTSALFLFFYCLWLLFLWASFFLQWTKYYLDVWYVTEKRIIDIDQKTIFDRDISNLRFDKIQDVTVEVDGFLETMLGFGTVTVQTAGEFNANFIMSNVRHPDHVREVIFNQHNEIGDTAIRHDRANTPQS